MPHKFILLAVTLALCGCGADKRDTPVFHWATVEKYKLENTATDLIKNQNPNSNDDPRQDQQKLYRDKETITRQIDNLKSEDREKCMNLLASDKKSGQRDKSGTMIVADSGAINRVYINSSPREIPSETNTKYRECISNIDNDQLTIDLQNKLDQIENSLIDIRKHDSLLRTKATDLAEQATGEYAAQRGYDLIVDSRQSAAIIFNKQKSTLDVTKDVIDYMKNMQHSQK